VVDVFTQAADGSRDLWLGDVATDQAGTFSSEVDAGCYVLTFIAPVDENFEGTGRWLDVPACVDGGQTTSGLDAVLETAVAGAASIGGVVTRDGSPASGVTVDLFTANADGSRGAWLGDTSTDAAGRFAHAAVPGCYVLTFIAPAGLVFENGTPWHQPTTCVSADQTIDDVNATLL
jgi:5-hydroxyisourate hydrolase-like protein (transthyretin family)